MNVKRKGSIGEKAFANWLQSKGIKAYKNSSSGGDQFKSDIHNSLGLNIEVKTVKRLNLKEAWKQTDRDSSLAKSQPMLAIHFDGMLPDTWLIVLHSEDWVEMVNKINPEAQKSFVEGQNEKNDRDLKYALYSLKSAIRNLEKKIEEHESR